MKKIVIVGATSAIATHCARVWVQGEPVDITLVGRDIDRTERIAADLRARSPQSRVRVVLAEFMDPAAIQATVDAIAGQGAVDIVLLAHGALSDQSDCQRDLAACRDALEVNGLSPVLYAEAFAQKMAESNRGSLALISSVAGDRGRRSNYVYGSAKGLVTRYAEGLQHRFAGTGIKVVLIKPGPTDTPMTAHLKAKGAKLASVEDVSKRIVDAIERRQAVVYVPWKWKLVLLLIRHLPRAIFNRLDI